MRRFLLTTSIVLALASGTALAQGQMYCGSPAQGALRVCHPSGTMPAYAYSIGNSQDKLVVLPVGGYYSGYTNNGSDLEVLTVDAKGQTIAKVQTQAPAVAVQGVHWNLVKPNRIHVVVTWVGIGSASSGKPHTVSVDIPY